jgi:hypothetical protein
MHMPELDAIRKYLEKYRLIVDSDRNRRTREMWAETRSIVLDKWRGCPRPVNEIGRPPVCAWLGSQFLRELFGTDLARYYAEPLYFLEHWLKTKIFHFETFDDDNYYDDFIPIWLGEGFEATLWGMTMCRDASKDPWIDRSRPIIAPGSRPSELPRFDFETTGLMPMARRFYEELLEIAGPFGFDVGFQNWGNGPLMTANYLAGVEPLAMAFLTDPEFAQQLIEHVTERRIAWALWRAEYLGRPVAKGEILDDDVSVPLVSPKVYRDFIFPAEKKLSDFHGGIAYWHDCGPADPYLEAVSQLGLVELMHAGPFTDLAAVARRFGNSAALEVHVRPASIHDNPELLRKNLSKIHATCSELNVLAYTIRLTAYRMPSNDLPTDLAAVQRWVNYQKMSSPPKRVL